MLKAAEVEIKKEHNMLLINKTTDFKKSDGKTKGSNGKKPQRAASVLLVLPRCLGQNPESSTSTAKGMVTESEIAPSTLKTRRPARLLLETKGYVVYT
jgi:hypothetical protein